MLTKISLKDFKAFSKCEIEIKPITLFLGPNNSGKSSVLAAPRILMQTLQSYDTAVPILLNGPLGDFGTFRDVVHKNISGNSFEIGLTASPNGVSNSFSELLKKFGIDSKSDTTISLRYKNKAQIKGIVMERIIVSKNETILFQADYSPISDKHLISKILGENVPKEIRPAISRRLNFYKFLPNTVFIPETKATKSDRPIVGNVTFQDGRSLLRHIVPMCEPIYDFIMGLEYLSATRIPPQRTFLYSGERHQKVGVNGENAANILAMDSIRRGKKSKKLLKKVSDWLKRADIASDIVVKKVSERHYEFYFQNPHTKEYENFADVGYGNSQVIPLLTAGYNIKEGETLIVEEPEIHLHPKAQAELASFFLDLNREKKNVLVETHSEHLVVRLQQYVAAGKIKQDDIAIYYIYAVNDEKVCKKITLDNEGAFKDAWPEGFFPQRLDEAKALARIRQNK